MSGGGSEGLSEQPGGEWVSGAEPQTGNPSTQGTEVLRAPREGKMRGAGPMARED